MVSSPLSPESITRGLGTVIVGRSVRCLSTVPSTMDVARDAARAGAAEGLAVFTDAQTAGRGRMGRRWQAPPGASLLVSVLLRPSPEASGLLTIAGALAACTAIEDVAGIDCLVKWPNDVLIGGRKVAGILAEAESAGTAEGFTVLGIGVNVNLAPGSLSGLAYPATSLSAESGHAVSRLDLARALLRHLDALYLRVSTGGTLLSEWRSRLATLGQTVRMDTGEALYEGVAEDVDETGALLLRRPDGTLLTLLVGEVTPQAGSPASPPAPGR